MTAYYNENDPFAAAWLRELIKAGHIAPGDVDERSIEDVTPADLAGYRQCHFFAGIGGWSLALRLAGIPDDYPVWTGSCPCQPFSTSGKSGGFDDDRHLWPSWYWLISQCRPAIVFGEQVASKATGPWFDLVQADLEALDYAFGLVPFPAAGIGAPHIRDRAYWVADSHRGQQSREPVIRGVECDWENTGRQESGCEPEPSCEHGGLADSEHEGSSCTGNVAQHESTQQFVSYDCAERFTSRPTGPTNGQWRDADWLLCRDGKWRPVEPGTFPLAHGVSNRVGRLRGYGNAIVPAQAAEMIRSYLDIEWLL